MFMLLWRGTSSDGKTLLKKDDVMKIANCAIISALICLLLSGTAIAHKVNLFAYAEGGKIYTESYFPDGTPVENGKVLVYDSQNKLLLEGVTDKAGLFSFDVPKVDDLTIVIEATMGHKNSFKLKKSEVAAGK
jgi:nickel transport protein